MILLKNALIVLKHSDAVLLSYVCNVIVTEKFSGFVDLIGLLGLHWIAI